MFTARCGPAYSQKIFCLFFVFAVQCVSQTIRGTVHNGTNGKPQPDDLVLLMTGTNEIGRMVSDPKGDFQIDLHASPGVSTNMLKVRVSHQGVGYQQPVQLGVAADVTVYDAGPRLDGVSEYLSIFQFEAPSADRISVTELHAIQNDSWPRRTRVNPQNFELPLPEEAHNLFVTITEPDGQGARLSFDHSDQPAPYRLGVPLKPGLTKYVLTYDLPYLGELPFRRSTQYAAKQTFIVLPMSMRFTPTGTLRFHPVLDTTGARVQEIDLLAKHALLAFQIAGTGRLAQAFRLIGGPDQSAQPTFLGQPAQVDPSRNALHQASPTSSAASSASNQSNLKTPAPGTHSEPRTQSISYRVGSAVVLFLLGTLIAWRVSRAKIRPRS